MVVDLFMVYQFLKRLTTPFEKWEAYKLGIIDKDGNTIKKRRELGTSEERKAWGYFDIMAANLKKLLEKLPGGSTKIATFAAALLLLKEHENNPNGEFIKEESALELKFRLLEAIDNIRNISKKYVAIQFTEETNNKLKKYAIDNGFDLSVDYEGNTTDDDFDFHTTVFYTNNMVDLEDGKKEAPSITAKVKSLAMLGKDNDVPVLLLDDGFLPIRKEYEKKGLKDEWPSWKPHISLTYSKDNIPDISKMKLPTFPIVAEYIKVVTQDENIDEEGIANVTGNSEGLTGEPPVNKKKKKPLPILKRNTNTSK